MCKKILCSITLFIAISISSYASEVPSFSEGIIRVGSCEMKVLLAKSDYEKMRGMSGFTDETFPYDGMLFVGNEFRKHSYHTLTMKINIRIIGLNRVSEDRYKVYGGAIYAPIGLSDINISGESILEIPERAFSEKFKNCIYQF